MSLIAMDFPYLYMFALTCVIAGKASLEKQSSTKILLMVVSSLCTFWFIQTQYVWLGLALWEIISIISAALIWGNEAKKLNPAINVLFISLTSGLFYLLAIYALPFDAGFSDISAGAIYLTIAIIIKSGLFPFLWPQIASVADYNTSALLHSVTAIQLGVHLAMKIRLWEYPLTHSILSTFAYMTLGFGSVYMILCRQAKKQLACLTQCANASILIEILHNSDVMSAISYGAICKSMLFVYLSRKIKPLEAILYVMVAQFAFYMIPFDPSVHGILSKGFTMFFFLREGWVAFHPNFGVIIIAFTQMLLSKIRVPKIPKISFSDIKLLLLWIISVILACGAIAFIRMFGDWGNWARLCGSNIQILTIAPVCAAMFLLFHAKKKLDFVLAMNIISACVAVLLIENGGVEIFATHVIADVIITIVLLRTDIDEAQIDHNKLWIIPIAFCVIVLLHRQATADLVFPGSLNEIIVNYRLQDTLGEVLVFTISRFL